MPWIWDQSAGALLWKEIKDGVAVRLSVVELGYAGHGAGRNKPLYQDIANMGPLPQGWYSIEPPRDTPKHGPYVLPLTPDPSNRMFQRAGFLIHGDDAEHDASKGCVILSRATREQIWKSGDHRLHVVDL